MDSVPEPTIKEFATLPTGYPDGFCFDRTGRMYCAGSLGDVVVVFEPDGKVAQVIEMGAGTEPTNCCLGDGVLYVTLSGPGRLVTLPISAEPLPLYPARR
jgi:gluconolactonase